MLQRLFYVILRAYVKLAMRIFYRRWQIVHKDKAGETGSIIFSSNHQNAFMDPLVILQSQNRIPVFLTQAAVFKSSALLRGFFSLLYMLPIYRQRDKVNTMKENEEIFVKCQDYLLKGRHPIGIFTEGSHSFKRTIRPLKKGICRLAFETLERNPNLDLKIIPVGLNYNDHLAFQTEVMVIFGEPLPVKPYFKDYLKNKAVGYKLLLDEVRVRMGEIIINIPNDENYDRVHEQWLKSRRSSKDLYLDFIENQVLVTRIIDGEPDDGEQLNREKIIRYKKNKILLRIILFPIWMYGLINNLLSVWVARTLLYKIVKDNHFESSFKFVIGTFVVPIVYLFQALVVFIFTQNFDLSLVYFFSLPFFSWIYFRWLR
jgi:1-acyl-sn-glycerol-3-phosphate acyltransferase